MDRSCQADKTTAIITGLNSLQSSFAHMISFDSHYDFVKNVENIFFSTI